MRKHLLIFLLAVFLFLGLAISAFAIFIDNNTLYLIGFIFGVVSGVLMYLCSVFIDDEKKELPK